MGAIIRFLSRWSVVLVFLLLQSIGFYLFVENSYYQRSHFINSSNSLLGKIYASSERWSSYLSLRKENKELLQQLDQELNGMRWARHSRTPSLDSLNRFVVTSAKVLRSSTRLQNNVITLDVGRRDGISKRDAVITSDGIVGIVKDVSEHFSTVISILSKNIRINGRLDNSEYTGVIIWNGKNPRKLTMIDLPSFVPVKKGDTVRTNSYSAIFPSDIPIAIVDTFTVLEGESMYDLSLVPMNDFRKLSHVMVVGDVLKAERLELEQIDE